MTEILSVSFTEKSVSQTMLEQRDISQLNKTLVMIMAVASGVTVANLYYLQPLLAKIAATFQVTQVSVGFAAMLTQAGYALGMLFLLPLADIR